METLKVYSPYDNSFIEEISMVGEAEIENALSTAYNVFKDQSKWIPAYERIEILDRVANNMIDNVEELIKTAAAEGGKPYMDSKFEVNRAINGVKLAIENIGQIKGEQIPMGHTKSSAKRLAYTMKEPIGVVSSISAFNHPLNLIIHQTVPAIAVGAPVIIKPASSTPLSCLAFMNILQKAGLPDEWCQSIICNRENAAKLYTDPRINYLSFIGSAEVGWKMRSKLAPGTHCALEHGGTAPVIVEADANIDAMLPALLKGGFYHAGQVCVSVQKLFVHQEICEEVTDRLSNMATNLIVGDPLDPTTEVGPLISNSEVDRVEKWVNEAIEQGAKLICGGKRISESCYEPTILLNPPDDAKVSTNEIFGPVVCIYSFSDRQKVINKINQSKWAFQASVFSNNLDVALDSVKKLNASAVMVNDHTAFRVDWMPFGGRDSSGIGIGGIPYSMHEMTREKLMVIKSGGL